MIRFVANVSGGVTDASYHLPAFYELWARWGPVEDRAFWAKATDVSRDLFSKVTGPETGLTPDRSNFDETPIVGRDGTQTPFSYDSWRSVSNWSVDYDWWQKDPREVVLSDRFRSFFIVRVSTSLSIATPWMASRFRRGIRSAWWPRLLWAVLPQRPVRFRRLLSKSCGTRLYHLASSAITMECFT